MFSWGYWTSIRDGILKLLEELYKGKLGEELEWKTYQLVAKIVVAVDHLWFQ